VEWRRRRCAALLPTLAAVATLALLAAAASRAPRHTAGHQAWPRRRGAASARGAVATRDLGQRRLQETTPAPACDDGARWAQAGQWEYLGPVERTAWMELGWDQPTWNDPGLPRPLSDSRCYQDLTVEQQDAVRLVGYTIQNWHACKNPTCAWPPGIPPPDAPCLTHLQYLDAQYNSSVPWASLTYKTKDALFRLGWDEGGARWAASDTPATYAKEWGAMSSREREAATFLGYTPAVWDGCEAETPCLTRFEILEAAMNSWMWGTMPLSVRNHLGELGWEEQAWVEGEQPAPYQVAYDSLPTAQVRAARLVGYTRDTWMRCFDQVCRDRFEYVQRKYSGVSWMAMKRAQQRAWILLGHSPELWAEGGMTNTRTMQMRWEELTPEQQEQAEFLGHTQETWQGCSTDWVSGSSPGDNRTNATLPADPNRLVRVRMTIMRPFSEISGNIYGAAIAQLPVSFIEVFERSVARALFCGNNPTGTDPSMYLDADGSPMCKLQADYTRQQEVQHRVRVLAVKEGSIIVDFMLYQNQTATDPTSPELFDALHRQLESGASPITQDSEFGKFARAASIEEMPVNALTLAEEERQMSFEEMRGRYNSGNACQLHEDSKNGIVRCATSSARGRGAARAVVAALGALSLLSTLPTSIPP